MSNFMHKVKDAVTGHHDQKGSTHDSSQMSHKTGDTRVDDGAGNYNSSARGSEARNTSSVNPQETSTFNSNKGNADRNPTTNTTTSTTAQGSHAMGSTGNYGSGGYGSGTRHDSRMADPMQGAGNTYGSNTMGTTGAPNTYNSSYAGGYGAAPSHGMSDTAHGTNVSGTHDYNTRSNAESNMVPQMKADESELHGRTGQQGFGGTAAAGGSSYNTQESGRRRSSGPHNSNLLNKLDPRVKSSDYESNTASGQQRG